MRNKYGEVVEHHGPVCSRCSQRVGLHCAHSVDRDNLVVCLHCVESPVVIGRNQAVKIMLSLS